MIVTLTWKELREHRAIWLTMVIMTCLIGVGLARVVAVGDERTALAVTTLTVLGLAAAYGVVCGAMMFAGEHENGTLVFLDIFHGRRELLWLGKTIIGGFLAVAQGLTVGLLLYLLEQTPPDWIQTLVGFGGHEALPNFPRFEQLRANFWFAVLPVLTLEAYAWGLLGSSITRRVLAAAAVGAAIATPVWLAALCAPAAPFLIFRVVVALAVTLVSLASFVNQSRETVSGPPPLPVDPPDPRPRLNRLWEELERERDGDPEIGTSETVSDVVIPVVELVEEPSAVESDGPPTPASELRPAQLYEDAESAGHVLWWLTLRQGLVVLIVLAAASFLIGVFMPASGQVLWPLATLALGVACGTAAFASEQRELSYEFLASQHVPLRAIWRFKIGFWLTAATLCTLLIAVSWTLFALIRAAHRPAGADLLADFHIGTLRDSMGTLAFFSMWLIYGFATAQVVVWYCRKTILALILSGVIAVCTLSVWLPSLLCRGLTGWQIWLPPLLLLAAGHVLVRAWAGGRIKERRPIGTLIGFASVALVWLSMVCVYRAWELPNAGEPMDRAAFRAAIPDNKANPAGKKIQEALTDFADQDPNHQPKWPMHMAELAALPVGVIDVPLGDGQTPFLRHLTPCAQITAALRARASGANAIGQRDAALDPLVQILALSRNLRNKAPLESYVTGVQIEDSALDGIERLLSGDKPSPKLLKRTLDALDRHVAETPPPLDCLQTECFRAGGRAANPAVWAFAGPSGERVPEQWIVRGIALSYETPWEDSRKTRLWRLVWAGLFRGMQTPHWELPDTATNVRGVSESTRRILRGWIPAKEGPDAGITAEHLATLLDASWLTDEALYTNSLSLRSAAHRSRVRTQACRLAVALALYRVEQRKVADSLQDLVPKYVSEVPIDPYSGQPLCYRVSPGEHIEARGNVLPNQGVVWSTGPDRVDNGGRRHAVGVPDDDPRWSQADIDLITLVPHWVP